ncbi:MAG: hypothetical protein AAFX59_12510, partial [Pseudomonadota bacterium]
RYCPTQTLPFGTGRGCPVRHHRQSGSPAGGRAGLGSNVFGIAGIRSAGGEVKLRQSEVALEVFVEEMVKAAQAQPGYLATNSNVIGEQTFAVALRSLCPIWPICP